MEDDNIDMEDDKEDDDSIDMEDASIDIKDDSIDMGYLVTLHPTTWCRPSCASNPRSRGLTLVHFSAQLKPFSCNTRFHCSA